MSTDANLFLTRLRVTEQQDNLCYVQKIKHAVFPTDGRERMLLWFLAKCRMGYGIDTTGPYVKAGLE